MPELEAGAGLAVDVVAGDEPGLVFLPGLRSHMHGAKATAVVEFARRRGLACVRLDYRGHGASSGIFVELTFNDWLTDVLSVIDRAVSRRLILIGSSMGAWLAIRAALLRPSRIAGLVGVAAAPDFTEELWASRLDATMRIELATRGVVLLPSAYGTPLPVTAGLIADGRRHLVLDSAVPLKLPVYLLHGQADPDVPWRTSLRLAARLSSADVTVELVKDGDHRLSRPGDLKRLEAAIDHVLECVSDDRTRA